MVSVIIPTYNEEQGIQATLKCLRGLVGDFEVIVVDGSSDDGTVSVVNEVMADFSRPWRLITAERNRAVQLNRAAEAAFGDVLLFLHADVLLPEDAVEAIENTLRKGPVVGGNFRLIFQGEDLWSRLFTWVNHLRRSFGIYYGDSGLFVKREVFERLGGFKPLPIMDDYEFVRRLEKFGRTAYLPPVLQVSDRRWRVQGVFRTLFSWFWVHGLYLLGVPAEHLARSYKPVREKPSSQP